MSSLDPYANSMDMQARGVAGIVTEGFCRDTDEVIVQKSPVACRAIGRTIIPGRTELHEVQVPVSCGGVQIRPGDIVGCDWDGAIVIPLDIAQDVLVIAARISPARRSRNQREDRYPQIHPARPRFARPQPNEPVE